MKFTAFDISKITTRIWILMIGIVFGIVGFVFWNYYVGERAMSVAEKIHTSGFFVLDKIRSMQLISRTFTPDMFENITYADENAVLLNESLTEIESLWEEITKVDPTLAKSGEFRDIFESFKKRSLVYQKAARDPGAKEMGNFRRFWIVSKLRLISFLDLLAEDKRNETGEIYLKERKLQTKVNRIMTIASVIVGLFFIALTVWIVLVLTKPLTKVIGLIHELSDGKFYARTDLTGKDEISQVGKTLDGLARNLSTVFGSFITNTKTLVKSTEDVSKTTQQIEKETEQISQNANQEVDLLNMSRTLILNIAESVNETTDDIQDLQKIATEAEKETEVVTESITSIDRSMALIQESGVQIEDIVSVITDISNRTNLLSLNAAIEAAKAGEYGKGFAVVADEVGKLAEKSATSVIEIQELIETSTRNIQEGSEVIRNTRKVLQNIIKLVQQISTMTNEAASKLTEHNRGMTEIAHSAEGVVSISELNSTSALELTETVKQITSTMDELRNMADVVDEALSHYSV